MARSRRYVRVRITGVDRLAISRYFRQIPAFNVFEDDDVQESDEDEDIMFSRKRKRRGSAIDHSDSDARRKHKGRGDAGSDDNLLRKRRRHHHTNQTQDDGGRMQKDEMRASVEPSEPDDSHSPNDSESGPESIRRCAPQRSHTGAKSGVTEALNRNAFTLFNGDVGIGGVACAGGMVYRAIHEKRVLHGLGQTPCMRCPSFDFCTDSGPVNTQGCVYYTSWLTQEAY